VRYGQVDALDALTVRRYGSDGNREHGEAKRRRTERAREQPQADEEVESGRRGTDRKD
jgi:hypothetical protein